MSHFAEISNGVVLRVIVAEQDFIDKMPGTWVQCSYNTRAGVNKDGGAALRKNYPGPGWLYDEKLDAFMLPKPTVGREFGEWKLDEATAQWTPPDGYKPAVPGEK